MTQFLKLNGPGIVFNQDFIEVASTENVCLCCLSQNEVVINLQVCSHTAFLLDFLKIDFEKHVICIMCHSMLKKIGCFKKQVEESYYILKHQLCKQPNKLFNLKQSKTIITDLTGNEGNIKQEDLKVEQSHDEEYLIEDSNGFHEESKEFVIQTDIKIEQDSSDIEDLPLSQIKKKEKEGSTKRGCNRGRKLKVEILDEKYEGKIKIVILKREELIAEREMESKKDSYLNMHFKCESCIRGFDHEETLKSHIEKQHKMRDDCFQCDICKSVLSSIYSYKDHVRRHFKRFECLECGKRICDINSLTQHYNREHGEGGIIPMQFACRLCDYTNDSYRAFRYHKEKHKQKSQCNICGKTFVNSASYRKHVNTVHNPSSLPFKCSICGKAYKCRSGLYNHMSSHGGKTAYCEKCNIYFTNKMGLKRHLSMNKAHITEESKKFVCNECDAKFLTKTALQTHIDWDHLKKDQFKCNTCSKVLKTAHTLKRHIRFVHDKIKLPKNKICDYCGRAFRSMTVLLSHIRTHTGDRPYICDVCPATFGHSAALYTHKKLLHRK